MIRYASQDGKGRVVASGIVVRNTDTTDARSGRATLVAGQATISTTAISDSADVLLTIRTPLSSNPLEILNNRSLYVGTVVSGTSFRIQSTLASDASVVFWMIVDSTVTEI